MQGTGRLAIDSSVIENEYSVEIGIDTQSSINQGVLASQLGAIEIAKRYAERKNIQLDLILLSGGNGKQLLNHQEHSDQIIKSHYEDNLVLKGLMVWCQSN
jgi:pantothenate kinase type III